MEERRERGKERIQSKERFHEKRKRKCLIRKYILFIQFMRSHTITEINSTILTYSSIITLCWKNLFPISRLKNEDQYNTENELAEHEQTKDEAKCNKNIFRNDAKENKIALHTKIAKMYRIFTLLINT